MGMGGGGGAEASDASPPASDGKKTVMLSADMLGGMQAKSGQKLTFCCTGDPDKDGNVAGYFEPMDGAGGDQTESWEDDFRKDQSARNPQEQMQ